jgi:hypothetical protein
MGMGILGMPNEKAPAMLGLFCGKKGVISNFFADDLCQILHFVAMFRLKNHVSRTKI